MVTGNELKLIPRFFINPYEVVRLFSAELLKSKSSKLTGLIVLPMLLVVDIFGEMKNSMVGSFVVRFEPRRRISELKP